MAHKTRRHLDSTTKRLCDPATVYKQTCPNKVRDATLRLNALMNSLDENVAIKAVQTIIKQEVPAAEQKLAVTGNLSIAQQITMAYDITK